MDLLGLLILLAAGLALGWLALLVYTVHLLTHPPRRGYAYAVSRGVPGDPSEVNVLAPGSPPGRLEYTEWTLRSHGMDLPVWDVKGLDPSGPVVLFTHGWGDSRVVLSRLPALASVASRVILWDLPGHGEAPGICRLGTREVNDLATLIGEVCGGRTLSSEATSTGPLPLVLYGSSLGAGVSIVAATSDERVRAVIAEAPYRVPIVPARNVLRVRGQPHATNLPAAIGILGLCFGHGLSWMTQATARRFDRAEWAKRLHTPLLVIHGTEDVVCPISDGRDIAAASQDGKIVEIAGAAHNDLWTDTAFKTQCTAAVQDFLRGIQT